TVCAGTVSPARAEIIAGANSSTPDDHLTAVPDCRVTASSSGHVGGAGGCPTIRARIVSPARVEVRWSRCKTAPDDHLTAGPYCRVSRSARGRIGGACGCPNVHAWIIFCAGVHVATAIISAPHDHFSARPDC